MYYNNITKEKTIYPYRFKTEDEFITEYGENWGNDVAWNYSSMNYLFGENFSLNMSLRNINETFNRGGDIYYYCENNSLINCSWYIDKNMVKLNKESPTYNDEKNLIYENVKINNNDIIIYKCKSDDEIIRVQELAFENGYEWAPKGKHILKFNIDYYKYIIFSNYNGEKLITRKRSYYTKTELYDCFKDISDNIIYIDNSNELIFLITNNPYNINKQLVYESVILKFNKYKKGDN